MSNRPPDWVKDPNQIPAAIDLWRAADSRAVQEAKAYAQMLEAIPTMTETEAGFRAVDTNGLMAVGPNLLHDLGRAAVSQVVKPITCKVSSVGGDRDTRDACEAVSDFVDGVLSYAKFPQLSEVAVRHSLVSPRGGHIFFDEDEDSNFVPRNLHPFHVHINAGRDRVLFDDFIPRHIALARFAKGPDGDKIAEYIESPQCPTATPESIPGVEESSEWAAEDFIKVKRAYALKCGKAIGKAYVYFAEDIISEQDWTCPVLPIASMVWAAGFMGRAHGSPMARSASGNASWLKELWLRIWDSQVANTPKVRNAPEGWRPTNMPFEALPPGVNGKELEILWPNLKPEGTLALAQQLQEMSGKASGIDENAQASTPPSEVKSGVGIASWVAVRNEALGPQHAQYDDLHEQAGIIILSRGPVLYKTKGAVVAARGTEINRRVKWSDLGAGEKTEFIVKPEVVSGLSKSLPHRVQLLELVSEKQLIDDSEYLDSLDMPDWKAKARELGGPRRWVEFQVSEALVHGRLEPPNEMQTKEDIEMLATKCRRAYLGAIACAPELRPKKEKLTKLRVLWRLANSRLNNATVSTPAPIEELDPAAGGDPLAGAPVTTDGLAAPASALPTGNVGLPTNPNTGMPAPVGAPTS